MNLNIPPERFSAHDKRDQRVLRYGLLTLCILIFCYFFAAAMGWLPPAFCPGGRLHQTAAEGVANPSIKGEPSPVDQIPYLGVPYAGTRFRFVPSEQAAIVIRPDFHSKGYERRSSWIIPSFVSYQGKNYTVTALSATAFLYAEGVSSVTLPSTLRYINGAHELMLPELETIIVQRSHDAPLILTPSEFSTYVNTAYPQTSSTEGAP